MAPVPGTKVQGDPENVPVPVLANATVPVGAVALTLLVSVTVALQVVDCPMFMLAGEQETVVIVLCPVPIVASSLVVR